jgi:hypothetical protein
VDRGRGAGAPIPSRRGRSETSQSGIHRGIPTARRSLTPRVGKPVLIVQPAEHPQRPGVGLLNQLGGERGVDPVAGLVGVALAAMMSSAVNVRDAGWLVTLTCMGSSFALSKSRLRLF